jgi:hypothetical protein
MTPAMSIHNIIDKSKRYTMIEKVIFMGAVASCYPPQGATGVEVVANEMEGELATAGIKEGSRWTDVDYRNPCLSMDFGTTLDGRITSEELPYAHTIGNLLGLAGAIPDAVVQGTGLVDRHTGATLDIFDPKMKPDYGKEAQAYAEQIGDLVIIEKVPLSRNKYGLVPVSPAAAQAKAEYDDQKARAQHDNNAEPAPDRLIKKRCHGPPGLRQQPPGRHHPM